MGIDSLDPRHRHGGTTGPIGVDPHAVLDGSRHEPGDSQPIGVGIGQGVQRQPVEQTHHRGGQADPEPEYPHGDRGKRPIPVQLPGGKPKVATQVRQPIDPVGDQGPRSVRGDQPSPGRGDVTQPPNSLGSGGRFGPPSCPQLLDPHLEVELDLSVDITRHRVRTAEPKPKHPAELRQSEHGQTSAALRTESTAAA